MSDLSLYTVEFLQKPYVKRPIVDSLLHEYVGRIRRASELEGQFKPHQEMFGSQNGNRNRFVHFYSTLPYYDITLISKSFAKEKTFDFLVKQFRQPAKPVLGKGGMIDTFLKKQVSFKELFSINT